MRKYDIGPLVLLVSLCGFTSSVFSQKVRFVPQSGHARQILSVGISDKLGIVASADDVGEVCIWECKSGRQIRKFNNAGLSGANLGFLDRLSAVVLGTPMAVADWKQSDLQLTRDTRNAFAVWSIKTGERIDHLLNDGNRKEIQFDDGRFERFKEVKLSGNNGELSLRLQKNRIVVEEIQSGNILYTTGPVSWARMVGEHLTYAGSYGDKSQLKPNEFGILNASTPRTPIRFSGIQEPSAVVAATGRDRLNVCASWWLNRIAAGSPDECHRPPYALTMLEDKNSAIEKHHDLARAMGPALSSEISSSGRFVASQNADGWGEVTGRRLADGNVVLNTKRKATCFAFSDSDQLAMAFTAPVEIFIYELANDGNSYEVKKTLQGKENQGIVSSVTFSPDSTLLSSGYQTWDLTTKKPKLISSIEGVVHPGICAFSKDGKYAAIPTIDFEADGGLGGSAISIYDAKNKFAKLDQKGVGNVIEDIVFSPSNPKVFASVDTGGALAVWKIGESQPICEYKTNKWASINGIEFDIAGRYVVALGMSNSGFVFDIKSKQLVLELVIKSSNEWIVSSKDGAFDTSSPGRSDLGSWIVDDQPFNPLPTEIFQRTNFELQLLSKKINGQDIPIHSLAKLNRIQPTVSVVGITASKSKSDVIDVSVKVAGASGVFGAGEQELEKSTGVYDLRLFRDGQLVGQYPPESADAALPTIARTESDREQWRKASLVCEADGSKTVTFPVQLPRNRPAGEQVEFTAYAFNRDRVKSVTARELHPIPVGLEKVTPTAFIVGVGVDAYEGDVVGDLDYAAADARLLLSDLVPRFVKLGYHVNEAALVSAIPQSDSTLKRPTESPASKENIRKTIERIQQAACPDDIVILCFSSHGYTSEDGMFYIFPHDLGEDSLTSVSELATDDRKEFLKTRCVSSDELSVWLRDVDAGEIVMIVDTCHSAAAVEGADFKPGPMGSKGLGQLAYDKGMRILTASQAGDVALESNKIKQGLLTYALVSEGLKSRNADANNDKQIDLNEWLSYAEQRVPNLFDEILNKTFKANSMGQNVTPRVGDTVRSHESKRRQGITIKLGSATAAVQTPRLFQFKDRKESLFLVE